MTERLAEIAWRVQRTAAIACFSIGCLAAGAIGGGPTVVAEYVREVASVALEAFRPSRWWCRATRR